MRALALEGLEAIAVVRAIVGLNPAGVEEYRTLLKKLEGAGGG